MSKELTVVTNLDTDMPPPTAPSSLPLCHPQPQRHQICKAICLNKKILSDDILVRILLLPVSFLYGLGISTRNLFYKMGLLRSVRFDLPVISVGNIAVGGTGKSPHIEYLIRWLHQYIDVGVLSRGYGRKTVGFREVQPFDNANDTGDEPLQFKRKFPEVPVTVSESRALGVPQLVKDYPGTQCVLLDDAFQHLAVTPGLNILLTEYARPFTKDWLLPSGRLREWRSAYQRADIIIVTKCPVGLTPQQRQKMLDQIDPYPRQKVFFSYYDYTTTYDLLRPDMRLPLSPDTDVLLVSAIANTDYLLSYLGKNVRSVHTVEFEDHHYFDLADLSDIKRRFDAIPSVNKVIVTTEKDATRLGMHSSFLWENQMPVRVLPIEVKFDGGDEPLFQEEVRSFLEAFKS
jgi:tetraacyldisaccharide 4'-kinase